MPRVNGVMQLPPGSYGAPNTSIKSAPYNTVLDDFVNDANTARPVAAGGTGATNATDARTALGVIGVAGGNYTGAITARASAGGPSYSTAAVQVRPVSGSDGDCATLGFHRPGMTGYSISHVGNGLVFYDGLAVPKHLFPSDGRIYGTAYGYLEDYFYPKSGGALNGRLIARASAGGPGYSTAAVEVRPVSGADSDWATLGFHRPGVSGYSIGHSGNGLGFYDVSGTGTHLFSSDGRIYAGAYGYLESYFFAKSGGPVSGTLTFGPGLGAYLGSNGDINAQRAGGTTGAVFFGGSAYWFYDGSYLTSNAVVRSGGAIFAGGAYLNVDGSVTGSRWSVWGSSEALTAISSQIESRANAYKDVAVAQIIPTIAANAVDGVGSYGLFSGTISTALNAATGTQVAGSNLRWSSGDAGSTDIGGAAPGTWMLCGYSNKNAVYRRVA